MYWVVRWFDLKKRLKKEKKVLCFPATYNKVIYSSLGMAHLIIWLSTYLLTYVHIITEVKMEEGQSDSQIFDDEKNDEAIYSCDLCCLGSTKFNLVSFLKHQKYAHINDSPYKCSYPGCKKNFKTQSEFRTHKRVAHKPRVKGGSSTTLYGL